MATIASIARWLWLVVLATGLGNTTQPAGPYHAGRLQDVSQTSATEDRHGIGPRPKPVAETTVREVRRVCRVTAYCDRGTTASGVPSGVGQCAAPADIPFGTKVYVPELDRTFVVTDRTAKRFRYNTVDIFIPTRKACRKFGRRYLECEFSIPADPPRYGSPHLAKSVAQLET